MDEAIKKAIARYNALLLDTVGGMIGIEEAFAEKYGLTSDLGASSAFRASGLRQFKLWLEQFPPENAYKIISEDPNYSIDKIPKV